MSKKLIAIFLIAFFIRLININQSLWLDEATTARVVEQYSFFEILNKFSITDFHPPLYYLLMKVWTNVFGYSEIALRMPSVLFSMLAGYLVYLLGKIIKDKKIGLWAAALFLFNPLIIYYSQDARMYIMTTYLLTMSFYFLIKMSQTQNSKIKSLKSKLQFKIQNLKEPFLIAVFCSLSLFTFYGSIFLITPILLYLIYKKQFKLFFLLLFTVTATILLLSPLLFHQLINARQQLNLVPNWGSVLGLANLKNLLLIPLKFSIGRISFEPKWFYWLVSGIWTAFSMFFVFRGGLKNKLLGYLFVVPLLLGVLFSIFTPLLQYFRFLYLIPILSILLAIGSSEYDRFSHRKAVVIGLFILSLLYLVNSAFHREDWKSLVESLPPNSRVLMIASSSDPVKYYKNHTAIIDLKNLPTELKDKEIYVIPYTSEIHGVDYRKKLLERDYKLMKEISFRGLILEKWTL